MFLQYAVLGVTTPIMSLYLREYLGFSGSEAGLVIATSSVASLAAPLLTAFFADKLISAERLFTLLHIIAAGLMVMLHFQQEYLPVLLLYLLYMIIVIPTVSLSNAVTFHHLPDGRRYFGGVRVWGTIGWIAVGWLFSFLWLRRGGGRLPHALLLAAMLGVGIGLVALLVPVTDREARQRKTLFPTAAFAVIRRPHILILMGAGFFAGFIDKFYYFGISPFFHQIGVPEQFLLPAMSVGQITEIAGMAVLSIGLARFGYKTIIGIGLAMELARFAFLIVASTGAGHISVAIAGLTCHGFAFAFFFIASFIYLNTHANAEGRTGVQQLFSMGTMGIGGFIGSLIAGWCMDLFRVHENSKTVSFEWFWTVPGVISIVALVIFLFFFNDDGDGDRHLFFPADGGEGADNRPE